MGRINDNILNVVKNCPYHWYAVRALLKETHYTIVLFTYMAAKQGKTALNDIICN